PGGVGNRSNYRPRVARASQPWALRQNPFGIRDTNRPVDCRVQIHLSCSQPCSARVTSGMTTQVRRATMQPLKTTLLGINGQDRIAAPSVRFKIAAVGKTPKKVANA